MKRTFLIFLGVFLIFSAGACKEKEEKPASPSHRDRMFQFGPQGVPFSHSKTKIGTKIVVPESVKGKWSAVKLLLEDKATKKTRELTVYLHSEYKIPNTNLRLVVGDFFPDFKIEGGTITSASNELNNPAVAVKVFEGEKEIFKGWLYAKYPAIHSFEHPKYGLILKEGFEQIK